MKQGVYKSPSEFMATIRREFRIVFDLAASEENAQANQYFNEEEDALCRSWHQINGWLWLNPPFSFIEPWAHKCWEESQYGAKILFLVPASVGSDWYANWVHGKAASVRFLRPRLVFEFLYPLDYKDKNGNPSPKAGKMNTDPYPKDLMLCVFDCNAFNTSPAPWNWKNG